MKNQENNQLWTKSRHNIFESFAVELKEFILAEQPLEHGDQDLTYALELQKKRLEDRDLVMKYQFLPRGHFAQGGGPSKTWSDDHYISRIELRTCLLERTFYRGKKKEYANKENNIFYQIITDVHNHVAVGDDLYTCPNCAAISKIKDLQNGCEYCGTFFEMSDLFPKVTNFFFIRDVGGTKKEVKKSISKVIIPCIILSIIGYGIYFTNTTENMVSALISSVFGGIVFGAVSGYFLWAITTIGSLFKDAAKSVPMLVNTAGSAKRFVTQMQRYSPEFSYEYFSDKVVSLLKMLIFAEDATQLPQYVGKPLGNMFENIVESSYTGAVALKKFEVKKDIACVTVDIYMEDFYDNGKRIYEKDDKFRVTLRKNIRQPIQYYFSIKKIQCKSCADSFDATKHRNCPSCGLRYEIGDDDWVVTEIAKR